MSMLIDGRPSASIRADDRGLLYGETVFETIAFRNGKAPLWSGHMNRLARGAHALGLDLPDTQRLDEECRHLLAASGQGSAVVRITLTAGSGGRGYWPADRPRSRRIVQLRDWPEHIEGQRSAGLQTMISRYRLGPPGPMRGLKHGNRLVQTLAARECAEAGRDEALLLDADGRLAEAISSNLVMVSGRGLLTPAAPDVAGVGLDWLKQELGEDLVEGSVSPTGLEAVDEVLVINSVAGIRPVVAVDHLRFEPGPVYRRLLSLWQSKLF